MTASGPRLCKDCRHATVPASRHYAAECNHWSSSMPARVNLVTGETTPGKKLYCMDARSRVHGPECGSAAVYWEALEQ